MFKAGEGNIEARIENYKTTINNIKLPDKLMNKKKVLTGDGTDNFDCVFWFGDFNFRIDKEKSRVVNKLSDVRKKRSINFEEIMDHDELYRVINEEKGFKHFLEGRITFEPTYKYEINSDEYDKSDKCRIPSYTVNLTTLIFVLIIKKTNQVTNLRIVYCLEVDKKVLFRVHFTTQLKI